MSLIYILIYLAVVSGIGLLLQEGIGLNLGQMLILLFDSLMLCVAIPSIFTFISMLAANKTLSIIIFVTFVLFSFELDWYFMEKMSMLNVNSLSYIVHEIFYHLLPMSQANSLFSAPLMLLENPSMQEYNTLWIYTLVLSTLLTLGGVILFKRKNIN